MKPVPVSVGIPTYARGLQVREVLAHIAACDPQPAEIIVHVDQSDGQLERELATCFPSVRVCSSPGRVGPGGGRHRCLQLAAEPYFASFDDDSWPLDSDFFAEIVTLFGRYPQAAILAASVRFPNEAQPERDAELTTVTDFTGCGCAVRVEAYRQTGGYIDRPWAYGIEETDLAMQLYALDWTILRCPNLRVFHNTQLSHHGNADVVASTVQNVALRAFLRYPVSLWPRALLQIGNIVYDTVKRRRFAGLGRGLLGIPAILFQYAPLRRRIPAAMIRSYLRDRRRLGV